MAGHRISKIEHIGYAPVYDLTVDNTPNYVLKGGVVSHNSGKSWTCLTIAEELDSNFTEERVVFNAEQLMMLLNSGTLKKGSVIIFEEAGVALSNRNWQGVINKVINYLFQTFRHKNYILLMNSPYMDFVDKATRKLFHAELTVEKINKDTQQTIIKPMLLQFNARKDKMYYKYLRSQTLDGKMSRVQRWAVNKPSKALRDAYEKKKSAYTKKLNEDIMQQIIAKEEKDKPKPDWECAVCGHTWTPRSKSPPMCPKCKDSSSLSPKGSISS